MKQDKKVTSRSKSTSRNYFNPYENTSASTYSTRTTYKQYTSQMSEEKPKKRTTFSTLKKTKKNAGQIKNKSENKVKPTPKATSTKKKTPRSDAKVKKKVQKASPQVQAKELTSEQRRAQMRKQLKLSQVQRIKMQRRRRYRNMCRIAIVMCLTVGLVWGGVSFKEYLTKPTVSTQVVKMGTLDTSTQFEGVILRNEKVIYSEESGQARYIIAEGEKVSKDAVVYVLVDEANLEATQTAKEEVESDIYNQAENNTLLSNYQDERYNLDQEVKNKMEDFYNNRYDNGTNYIYTLRSQLESSIANRTSLYVKEQETKNQDLVVLKEQIEEDLGSYQKGKGTTESGIVSYRMDGYETENAETAIEEMTKANYQKLRKAGTLNTLGQSEMSAGDPIYKVVLNNDWYIISFIEASEAEELVVGQTYNLHFDELGGQIVSFTLSSKEEKDKSVEVVFKTNNQIGDFLDTRSVSFSIGEKATSGLKIPTQAIVEQNLIKIPVSCSTEADDEVVVYRQKGEITETIPLNVQYTQDEMHYIRQDLTNVNTIQVNDILVEPDNGTTHQVTEVDTQKGVYVVNNKVAKFREISILVQSDEYAIVKYTSKSQLKEMDKIISDPKSIKMDQLLDDMKVQNE